MINDSNIQYLIQPESQFDVEIKRMIQLWEQEMANLTIIKPELLPKDNYSTSTSKIPLTCLQRRAKRLKK